MCGHVVVYLLVRLGLYTYAANSMVMLVLMFLNFCIFATTYLCNF